MLALYLINTQPSARLWQSSKTSKLQLINSRINETDPPFLNFYQRRQNRAPERSRRTLLETNPPGTPMRLLFVDNTQTDYTLLVRFIDVGGYRLQSARVETVAQMREALSTALWDAVISELELPGFPLAEVLNVLRECGMDTPCIVVTGTGGEDAAVEALVAGADDYVSKSRLTRLVPALKRSIAAAAARREERAEHARLRLLRSHLDHVSEVKTVAIDLHDAYGELMNELAPGLTWFACNTADDAAKAHVQNMQHAIDRARARAERGIKTINDISSVVAD